MNINLIFQVKEAPKATLKADSLKLSCSIKQDKDWVYLLFTSKDTLQQNFMRFSAKVNETSSNLSGLLNFSNGSSQNLTLIKDEKKEDKTTKKEKRKTKQNSFAC